MPRSMRDLSSPTKDRTRALALEAWSLNHWTAREVPKTNFYLVLVPVGKILVPKLKI